VAGDSVADVLPAREDPFGPGIGWHRATL
jgi:hypothetical protein